MKIKLAPASFTTGWITDSSALAASFFDFSGYHSSRKPEKNKTYQQTRILRKEIDVVATEASEPNWNHEGAAAVDPRTIEIAKELVAVFPKMDALPDVSATPFGEVYFEWVLARDRMLTLSVGPPSNHEIVFAAMFGTERTSGRQHWSGTLPRSLECCFRNLL